MMEQSVECFAAACCLVPAPQDVAKVDVALRRAVGAVGSESVRSGATPTLVWASAVRAYAGDVAVHADDGQIVYVDGPVTRLDAPPLGPRDLQADPRISTITAAARACMAGRNEFRTLSGSFCALRHDAGAQRTLVITDRLGSRPLFYAQTSEWLFVASDLRVLLALPGVAHDLDAEAIAQFIRYQMILGVRTLYRAIKAVPPATVLDVNGRTGRVEQHAYWSLGPLPVFGTRSEAIEAAATAFAAATNRIMVGSQRPALLLSGGFDSRMLLASLDQPTAAAMQAYTFGPARTDEVNVAQRVAHTRHVPWQFIEQPLHAYWNGAAAGVVVGNGLYSAAHQHLHQPTGVLTTAKHDAVLNGWGFDLPFSGSYFSKETFTLLGRQLYTYRLSRLHTQADVINYLAGSLDVQGGVFEHSLFGERLRATWQNAPHAAVEQQIAHISDRSDVPYDWIDYALVGCGIAKFRSYGMLNNIRAQTRERNPLFESDVLQVYQRLPYQWRFLGPVFRRAVRALNPALAALPYSNTGVSAFAPPMLQAAALQLRAAWRANVERTYVMRHQLGMVAAPPRTPRHGGYHDAAAMACVLQTDAALGQHVHALLVNGPLAQGGYIDPARIGAALERCARGHTTTGYTVMAWAALALWFDAQPVQHGAL